MIIVTTETVPGHRLVRVYGLVSATHVRAKNVARDFGASLKGLVGGEIKSYTALMTETRNSVIEQLSAAAHDAGCNAVVGLRMTAGQIAQGAAEVYAYGTAAVVEPFDTDGTGD